MGNLGRPGYGATTDGLWPYTYVILLVRIDIPHADATEGSYDTCDWGTLPNQTFQNAPAAAATAGGNSKYNDNISWLPGQRLSYVVGPFSLCSESFPRSCR